jgi:2-dehydropantoate 2-reductase
MKIVILGAGALGSIAAAYLARAGADVSLIARGPRAKLLAQQGVTIRATFDNQPDFNVSVPIVERPEEVAACDSFMLTAKTYDTASALAAVRGLKADMAFSVQNGVAKNDALAKVFDWPHTVGCIANFSGEVLADGVVAFTRNSGLYLGELPSGESARINRLVEVLNASGLNAIAAPDIETVEWSKFATWLGITAVGVLSRLHTHLVYQDPDLSALQVQLITETARLAEKSGVRIRDLGGLIVPATIASAPSEDSIAQLVKIGEWMEAEGVVTHRMSALQDLLRGRRLEVEETYGWAVERARERGVEAPALETCYRLLAALNRQQG